MPTIVSIQQGGTGATNASAAIEALGAVANTGGLITGNLNVAATLITQNVLPDANITYDLGSNTARFKDLWLSNSTIHLGEATISSNGGTLVVPAMETTTGMNLEAEIVSVSNSANNRVLKTGDTMTGELNVANNLVITGNVGIGTSNITSKLTVSGNINLDANARFGLLAENDIFTATNGVNTAQYGITFSPDLLGISGYFGLGLYTSGSERIRVSGNGNVGIATTSPISTLHSNGAFTVTKTAAYDNTENYNFRFSDSANTNKTLWGGYDTSLDGGFIQSTFTGVAHKPLFLNPNGGNVSIGTTTTTARLSLAITANNYMVDLINASEGSFALRTYNHGTTVVDGVSFSTGLYYNTEENASIRFYRGGASTGGFLSFSTNNGSEKLRITSGGAVGIGTSSPASLLHAYSTAAATIKAEGVAFSSSIRAAVQASDGGVVFMGSETSHPLAFLVNNTEFLRLGTSGYLGFSAAAIGNLASNNIAALDSSGIRRYSFSIQADNVWRTLVSNFDSRRGIFFLTLSDEASGDVAGYSFRSVTPAYGIAALNQIFYHDGSFNTGTFEFRIISTGSVYQLEVRFASYYSSSNIGYANIYFWMLD